MSCLLSRSPPIRHAADIPRRHHSGRAAFIWTIGAIVALGSLATAISLWQQWDDQHGKPFVFGFDAAGTYFLGSFGFLIIALVTNGGMTWRRTTLVSALIFLPTAIFAASQVRFTFLAFAGALGLTLMLSEARQRKYVVAVGLVILLAIGAGLLARYDKARIFADYAMEQSSGEVGLERPPSCYLKVNLRNSIAIRKVLVQDALFLIPRSEWIGTGLDSFMKFSCIKLTEVHNSILQATVEFGWLGGSLLLAIIIVAAGPAFHLARYDDAARFVLCSLFFVVLLSLAHGRVSRDGVLFTLLGCVVGVKETCLARAGEVCGGCIGYAGDCAQYHATYGISAMVVSATRSRFWLLSVDVYPVLVAASIPWSTSAVAIFMVIWFVVLIPTIEPRSFVQSLKRPAYWLPLAFVALAAIGTLWGDAPWPVDSMPSIR